VAALSLLSSIFTKTAVGAKGMKTVELLRGDARVTFEVEMLERRHA